MCPNNYFSEKSNDICSRFKEKKDSPDNLLIIRLGWQGMINSAQT